MPVSVSANRDPFRNGDGRSGLRTPQARVLQALMPECPSDPLSEWPLYTRAALAWRAGYTAISGTMTRALNGIRVGSSSGDPHPGLLTLGYIEEVVVDVVGLSETNYRITMKGMQAFQHFLKAGGNLPPVRDAASCTNERYKKEDGNAEDT